MHISDKYFYVALALPFIIFLSACESIFNDGPPPTGDVPGTVQRPVPVKYSPAEAVNQMSTAMTMKMVTMNASGRAPVELVADEQSASLAQALLADLYKNKIFRRSGDSSIFPYKLDSNLKNNEWAVSLLIYTSSEYKQVFTKTIIIDNNSGTQPK